jgi:urease accessory protein
MRPILLCVALVGALISPAFAHTGAGETNSFISGIAHPLNGTDHILAMVALGFGLCLQEAERSGFGQ